MPATSDAGHAFTRMPGLRGLVSPDNPAAMARSVLILIAIFTLAICNLHSSAMLHVDDAHDDDHAVLTDASHSALAGGHSGDLVAETHSDSDQGVTHFHDHHSPAGLTVAGAAVETPFAARDARQLAGNAAALLSWATAPPIEPPAA